MLYRNTKAEHSSWTRIKSSDFYTNPELRLGLINGEIEIKDSSPKQAAQNKMWQLSGRIKALHQTEIQLVKELRQQYPKVFKNKSHTEVLGIFYADVTALNIGLLLKQYNPELYHEETTR